MSVLISWVKKKPDFFLIGVPQYGRHKMVTKKKTLKNSNGFFN